MSRLIDADQLKRIICQDQCELPDGCGGSCEMIDYVEDAPTIEAKPAQPGMWVYCEDEDGQDGYQCTNCGFFEPWYYKYEEINFIHNYKRCPGCGSVMTEMSCGEVSK